MFSNEDKYLMEQLMESNTDFKYIINKLMEENRQILSSFTHEIRNPLTLIKSTIQLIETQHPEANDFKFWSQLRLDIDDTVHLLNELSNYNHCDQVHKKPCDLYELIMDSTDSFQPFSEEKNITISTQFNPDVLSEICSYPVDNNKFKQVLNNILKNAIEAAVANSTITLSVTKQNHSSSDKEYINISITNQGETIPDDQVDKLFDPFVTFKPNGTGLGLAISQKIVNQHDGTIVISQDEHAVTFTIELPIFNS